MKLFVATSISGEVTTETHEVLPEFRKFVETLLNRLRETGKFEVFCAIEQEGWVIPDEPPEIGVRKDLQAIDETDVLLALVNAQPSAGVQLEIGYAMGKGKRVVLASSSKLAYMNQGLANLGRVEYCNYETSKTLVAVIEQLIF